MKRHSPAAERNRQPILEVLLQVLPAQGRMLELAAGTGQHAVHMAAHLPGWVWQPTDPDPQALASIAAWSTEAALPKLLPPQALDLLQPPWPVACPWDAVFCANMLHIAPWACCEALMQAASQWLQPQGQLITYGPYFVQGEPTAQGNLDFDADLRQRNPAWGIRWLHEVTAEAQAAGLQLCQRTAMPANNQVLVFRHAPR